MFDQLIRDEASLDELGALSTLQRVEDLRAVADKAEVGVVLAAQHWADLHGAIQPDPSHSSSLPGSARLCRLGGEGTPEVDDLCVAEFGAFIGTSQPAAWSLLADALDLRHRLPRLWASIEAGEVQAWVGRRIAQLTRNLSAEACAKVDCVAARHAPGHRWGRLEAIVEAAVIAADPDAAHDKAEAQRDEHGVWLSRSTESGTKTMFARGDAADLTMLDATVGRIAGGLAALGSPDPERRARALGVIASPQQALNLFADAANVPHEQWPAGTPQDPQQVEEPVEARAQRAAATGASSDRDEQPRHSNVDPRPRATLYVHIAAETLVTVTDDNPGHPVCRVEGIGPVTLDQARRWLRNSSITLKPVIDLNTIAPADCYEIPDRIREAVRLAQPAEVFPYSTAVGRIGDLDHSDPYLQIDVGGLPGQTAVGKLGPLLRRSHRNKTHGDWQLKQPFPGIFVWRSPHGAVFVVGPTGTRRLE